MNRQYFSQSGNFKVLFLLFVIWAVSSRSQSNKDSLLAVLKSSKEDTNKVKTLNYLSDHLLGTGDFKMVPVHAQNAIALSDKLNFRKGLVDAYKNLGIHAEYTGDYPRSLEFSSKMLAVSKELNDGSGISQAYNNMAVIFEYMGKFPEALKHHLESLKLKEALGDKEGIAISYVNIASLYGQQENYDEAEKYFSKALKIYDETKATHGAGFAHSGLGSVYQSKGDHGKALTHHLKSYEAWKATGDQQALAFALNNIGMCYVYMGEYKISMEKLNEALALNKASGDRRNTALTILSMAGNKIYQKKFTEAKPFLDSSLAVAAEIGDVETIREVYRQSAKADSGLGNFVGAFENYKNFILYRDSVMNEANTKKTVQAQMQYDFDKKEAEAKSAQLAQSAVAAEKLHKQKIISWSVLGGGILVFILLIVAWLGFRNSKKANAEISNQKKIIEEQKKDVENAFEKLAVRNKEVLDSIRYAKRIQHALITSERNIEKLLQAAKASGSENKKFPG
jgi:tetratricopeptide (TPR) repeat protein